MDISEAYEAGFSILKKAGIENPSLEARILLRFVLNVSLEKLFTDRDMELAKEVAEKFFSLIGRRKNFEPIAYILQNKEFYGRSFYVNDKVLIPRPESETLIDSVLARYGGDAGLNVLELGVGSSCLIATLALERSAFRGTGVDICPEALGVAEVNLKKFGLEKKIKLTLGDWFGSLKEKEGRFDILISNPPYISPEEKGKVARETILYEPAGALFSEGGLKSYREIAKGAKSFLKEGGLIFLELGLKVGPVIDIFEREGFLCEKIEKDLSGKDRVAVFLF